LSSAKVFKNLCVQSQCQLLFWVQHTQSETM
jgi:hypothetical protein